MFSGFRRGLDRSRGKLVEGRVGRREDREGTGALQRIDEARGLHRRDERRVVLGVDRVLDDVLAGIHRGAADHLGHLGEGRAGQSGHAGEGEKSTVERHVGLLLGSTGVSSPDARITGARVEKFQHGFSARQPMSRRQKPPSQSIASTAA